MHKRNVRGVGEHGKLGIWQADDIAGHTTAAQAKQFDRGLGPDDIGIPVNEQGGGGDRLFSCVSARNSEQQSRSQMR
jgi:hypothetical protein